MTQMKVPSSYPDMDAHDLAFTEVSFLLDIFASTIEELMGGATASVGRIAGRELAKKLPIYKKPSNRHAVIEAIINHFSIGYDICLDDSTNSSMRLEFKNCAIREVCRKRGTAPGGELCQLFHYYFGGVINELVKSPVKSDLTPAADVCRCEILFK